MSHFYTKLCDFDATFIEEVSTPTQANKYYAKFGERPVPSVTTVLGIKPNLGLSIWWDSQIAKLAREYQNLEIPVLRKMAYGMRTSPVDGTLITAADFGTQLHEEIENANHLLMAGDTYDNPDWNDYVSGWLEYVEQNEIEPIWAEWRLFDDTTMTAGTIDLVARVAGDRYELFDYKSRDMEEGKIKAYDKDCQQLAIEADIVRRRLNLPYTPRINTVAINTNTGETIVKQWKYEKQYEASQQYRKMAMAYWLVEMGVSAEDYLDMIGYNVSKKDAE